MKAHDAEKRLEKDADLSYKISHATVVSFDFFDTLFSRPVERPEHLFDVIGERLGIKNFPLLRQEAQTQAFVEMHRRGEKEITLDGIYACIDTSKFSADVSTVKQLEYDLELKIIEPIAEVFNLFSELVSSGKTVVVISDMYLPRRFFEEAFDRVGYPFSQLYVSSELNATKRDSGELFNLVLKENNITPEAMLHIGDNPRGDVVMPESLGINTFHYEQKVPGAFENFKGKGIVPSICKGILSQEGPNVPENNLFFEAGFIFGGAAQYGFYQWMKERIVDDNVEYVLFQSRDGYSLSKVAGADSGFIAESCYFLGSRTSFTLSTITPDNFEQFLPYLLSGSDGLAPYEVLERIGVPVPDFSVLNDLGLSADIKLNANNRHQILNFLYSYRWEIIKICRKNRQALFKYLNDIGATKKSKIALVDVGWSGTSQESFISATHKFLKAEVLGYYFCLADTPEARFRKERFTMRGYVNESIDDPIFIEKIFRNRVIFELFFSAPHPTIIGYERSKSGSVEAVYDAGRSLNNKNSLPTAIADIIDGVDFFLKKYPGVIGKLGTSVDACQYIDHAVSSLLSSHKYFDLLASVESFDTWGSSKNNSFSLKDYL